MLRNVRKCRCQHSGGCPQASPMRTRLIRRAQPPPFLHSQQQLRPAHDAAVCAGAGPPDKCGSTQPPLSLYCVCMAYRHSTDPARPTPDQPLLPPPSLLLFSQPSYPIPPTAPQRPPIRCGARAARGAVGLRACGRGRVRDHLCVDTSWRLPGSALGHSRRPNHTEL